MPLKLLRNHTSTFGNRINPLFISRRTMYNVSTVLHHTNDFNIWWPQTVGNMIDPVAEARSICYWHLKRKRCCIIDRIGIIPHPASQHHDSISQQNASNCFCTLLHHTDCLEPPFDFGIQSEAMDLHERFQSRHQCDRCAANSILVYRHSVNMCTGE